MRQSGEAEGCSREETLARGTEINDGKSFEILDFSNAVAKNKYGGASPVWTDAFRSDFAHTVRTTPRLE